MANENVQPLATPRISIGILEALIQGKVTDVSNPQNSEFTYYNIATPAKDQYSNPNTLQISQPANQRPFARVGDEVKIKVSLGGYGRRNNGNLYISNTLNFVELA
jgi:hypothetical protein